MKSSFPPEAQERMFWRTWQFRSGVISLRDVQTYLAERLVHISNGIHYCHEALKPEEMPDPTADLHKQIPTFDAHLMASRLKEVEGHCTTLSLSMTAKAVRLLIELLNEEDFTPYECKEHLASISLRLDHELEDRHLFLINPDVSRFFNRSDLAGEQFKAGFPRANVELSEAGSCLALGRYTASVFHVMRALDIVLDSLQAVLGIPKPDKLAARTWGRTLERIKAEMDKQNAAPTPQWAQDKEFYDKAYSFIQAAKTAFRDTTMHVESTYDHASADSVFVVSVVLLKHVATKLKE